MALFTITLFSSITYDFSNRLLNNIRGWWCLPKVGLTLNHSCFFLGPSNRPYVKYNSFANYWPDARGAADEALWREKTDEKKIRKKLKSENKSENSSRYCQSINQSNCVFETKIKWWTWSSRKVFKFLKKWKCFSLKSDLIYQTCRIKSIQKENVKRQSEIRQTTSHKM